MRSGSATDSGPRSWGAALALAVEGVVTSCRKEGQGGEEERRRGGGGSKSDKIKRPSTGRWGKKIVHLIQYIGIKGHSECKWINKR